MNRARYLIVRSKDVQWDNMSHEIGGVVYRRRKDSRAFDCSDGRTLRDDDHLFRSCLLDVRFGLLGKLPEFMTRHRTEVIHVFAVEYPDRFRVTFGLHGAGWVNKPAQVTEL